MASPLPLDAQMWEFRGGSNGAGSRVLPTNCSPLPSGRHFGAAGDDVDRDVVPGVVSTDDPVYERAGYELVSRIPNYYRRADDKLTFMKDLSRLSSPEAVS